MLHHNPSLGEGFVGLMLLGGQGTTPPAFVRGFAFSVLLCYALVSPIAQQFYLGSQSLTLLAVFEHFKVVLASLPVCRRQNPLAPYFDSHLTLERVLLLFSAVPSLLFFLAFHTAFRSHPLPPPQGKGLL